jgi:hypothetical protein
MLLHYCLVLVPCADVKPLSDECNEEVMAFKINRNSNINKNLPLGKRQLQLQ